MTQDSLQTALTEKENMTIFISTLSSTYYGRLIGHPDASFTNLVQTEERIEDGFKMEKIKDYQKLFEQSPNRTRRTTQRNFSNQKNEKSEKEVHTILGLLLDANNPMFIHVLYFSTVPQSCHVPATCDVFCIGFTAKGTSTYERKIFTPLVESLTKLLSKLLNANFVTRIQSRPIRNSPP